MKKKNSLTKEDKKNWDDFLKNFDGVYDKDFQNITKSSQADRMQKLDLHGLSLIEANKVVKKFIIQSFNKNYRKILIVTGKELRSKVHDNPYVSESLNVLKNSVPEFIKNNEEMASKIIKISKASVKDGGDGAFYIFLKKKKKFIK